MEVNIELDVYQMMKQKFSNQQKTEEIIIYESRLMLKIIWQL